jgi:malonate transporter
MQILLDVLIPVFMIVAFGYISVWTRLFDNSLIEALVKFTQSFAIPVLLLKGMSEVDLTQTFDPALLTAFYLGATVGFFLGFFGARILFRRDWEDCVAIGFCALFSNSLMLGLAITERAYGSDALQANFAIITLHAPFCYGLGITVMEIVRNSGKSPLSMVKNVLDAMFKNALVIGILAGFLINVTGIDLPSSLETSIDMIAGIALTVALFSMGGILYRYRPDGDLGVILMIAVISLLVHPALVWIFGKKFGLDTSSFRSAVLTSAMAPGINTYIFANMYGRVRRIAASSVLITTSASLLTVWWWISHLP